MVNFTPLTSLYRVINVSFEHAVAFFVKFFYIFFSSQRYIISHIKFFVSEVCQTSNGVGVTVTPDTITIFKAVEISYIVF